MFDVSHEFVSFILQVILIISYLLLILVLFITSRDALIVKEKMTKKDDKTIEKLENDERVVNINKSDRKSGIRKASSWPTFPSDKGSPASPPRRYSRRLSKTESEETADILLEKMFAPSCHDSPCRLLARSFSDNAVTRRRKYGFSKGSFGLSINSLNIIKEAAIQ